MNTLNSIPQLTRDKALLKYTIPNLISSTPYTQYAKQDVLGKGRGTLTASWSKYPEFTVPAVPTAISEGVTPPPTTLTRTEITATLQQYGNWVPLSDRVLDVAEVEMLKIASERLVEYAGQEINVLVKNILDNGTNSFLANGVAAVVNIATAASSNDLNRISTTLDERNVLKLTDAVAATTGIGTTPIQPSYIAIVPAAIKFDLYAIPNFRRVETYNDSGRKQIHRCEIGEFANIRFISTNIFTVALGAGAATATLRNTGGNTDVYTCYIFGAGAYGVTSLLDTPLDVIEKLVMEQNIPFLKRELKGVNLHMEGPNYGIQDPLKQKGFASYKYDFAGEILQQNALIRYRVGITA